MESFLMQRTLFYTASAPWGDPGMPDGALQTIREVINDRG